MAVAHCDGLSGHADRHRSTKALALIRCHDFPNSLKAAFTNFGRGLRRFQGRASKTMLNGVSVAFRTLRNPPSVMAAESLATPACAPNAAPTG